MNYAFESDYAGPPRRRLYLWRDEEIPPGAPVNTVRGWGFAVSEFDSEGLEYPVFDTWEETLSEILRYPPIYGPGSIWRRSDTGEAVDISAL